MSNMNSSEQEGGEEPATSRSKYRYRFVRPGSKVEVRSDEDGYQNAWFPATVVELGGRSKRKSEAVVVYDHMLDEGTQRPLVEKVDVRLIRPTPPEQDSRAALEPNDVVDAFYDDVWWTGYVVRRANDRYTVAFKSPPDVLELGRSHLRVHWDWVDNSFWDRPSKEANTNTSSVFSPAMEVEVDPEGVKPFTTWFPGIYLGEISSGFHMVKYKSSAGGDNEAGFLKKQVHYDQIRPRPPKFEARDFELLEKVNAFHGLAWTVGMVSKVLVDKKYTVNLRHLKKEVDFECSKLRPHLDWIDNRWFSNSKVLEFKSKHREFARKCDVAKSIDIINLDESSSSAPVGDDEEVTFSKSLEQNESSPIFGSSTKQKVNQISNDKSAELVLTGNDEVTIPNEAEEMTDRATKLAEQRETPQKFEHGEISRPSKRKREAGKENSEVLGSSGVVETADNDIETSNPITEDGALESGYPELAQSSGIEPEHMDTDIVERDAGMSCGPESPIVNLETQIATGSGTGEAVVGVEDGTNGMLEVPGSACSKLTDSQAHESTTCLTNVNCSEIPFTKSSQIWKFLESMDVFVRFPQSPHFLPLSKHSEREREGVAVGHMVNFANMMVRISKLSENVSKEAIDHLMRGFSTYEELGFDLKFVKDQLNELLKTKAQIESLEAKSKRLSSSVKECVDQETIIEKEVTDIDLEIEKLTGKRAMLMSDSTKHRSKIARLSSEAEAIDAELLSMKQYSSGLRIVI